MTPSDFPQRNAVFGEGQEQYIPIPVYKEPGIQGKVTSYWRGSWRERWKFLATGQLWLQQLSFNMPLQPQLPLIDCPFPDAELEHATIGSETLEHAMRKASS